MPSVERARDFLTSRLFVRGVLLGFFVFACVQLLRFAEWARGRGPHVPRPESVAGLLPIGHFTSFFAWLKGGGWDTLLPAGLVIIIGAVATSVLLKRGFCGWICPLGAVWEGQAWLGRKLMGGRNVALPRWLDGIGRGVRYLIAAAALFVLIMVPLAEALAFRELPYMWVADLKILGGFTRPGFLAMLGVASVASVFFGPVWCRWLCPLGGWYSLLGMASPCAVRRDPETCIHCSACTEACHAFLDVEKARAVRSPECDGCMDCVRVCPVPGCLEARAPGNTRIAPWVWPLLVVGLWLAIYAGARLTGNWDTRLPDDVFRQVINSGLLEERTRGGL
ncbi:MAG: (4Fe-4S)-binding protein [Coriobacteriaceae bacterium]|nr:(4Fe-4S)-binding protein [Coriobacteriaceae bacterium]